MVIFHSYVKLPEGNVYSKPPQKIEMSKIVMNYCSILFFDDEIEYRTCHFFWYFYGAWWDDDDDRAVRVVRLWGETVGTQLDMNGDWTHQWMMNGVVNGDIMCCISIYYNYIYLWYTYMSMVIWLIWIVLTCFNTYVWSKILVISNQNWELNPRDIFQRGCFQVDLHEAHLFCWSSD